MRVLNDKERAEFLAHGETSPRQLVNRVAEAQHKQDMRDFVEWFNTEILLHARNDTKDVVWLRLGEMKDGVLKYRDSIESLKQLVEE